MYLLIIVILSKNVFSQIIYNPKVDSIINLVSLPGITKYAKELSGDTITLIGGLPYRIYSRYNLSPSKNKAAQYIYEKFQSYGLSTRYQIVDSNCTNVIGTKTGTKYPNQYFIICAHYDAVLVPLPSPTDTVPGADDDASGICAVLESARLLNNFNSSYSLVFIAFDREEVGPPPSGSQAFVDSIYTMGDTLRGVLDLDMLAWDGNFDNKFDIGTNNNSDILADQLIGIVQTYQIGLQYYKWYGYDASDISSFWQKNYKGILFLEDFYDQINPNMHSINDKVNTFNLPFFNKMTKAAIALFSTWGSGYFAQMNHTPLLSFYDTTSRIVNVEIFYPLPLGTGTNAPRLYYKLWNGSYNYINAYYVFQNNYKFLIPGQPRGSKISYYIAAQDSAGTYVFTLPAGGGGINPPGTTPPSQQFTYYIWTNKIVNSITVPKPITGVITQDTIHVQTLGNVVDVNVLLNLNHTNDGNLNISLAKLSNTSTLSQYNCLGGQNFTNTIFDDSAAISITQGNPPFTGRFRPQTPLTVFRSTELSGDWILRIVDIGTGNTGTLLNWGLEIVYAPTVTINNNTNTIPDKFSLFQNYPNPFNPVTKIKFDVPKSGFVVIKVFDILGKQIATIVNENLTEGSYEVTWNASQYPSGIYFYKLKTGDFTQTKKMILVK